jgi:hypothetical protein
VWNYRFSAWSSFLCLLALAAGALLIGPPVPADRQSANCVQNLRISEHLGISMSCDSPEYVILAGWPTLLQRPDALRQARPGAILIAFLLEKPLRPLVRGISMPLPEIAVNEYFLSERWRGSAAIFLAYIMLNFAILIATFWWFLKAIGPLAPAGALTGIGVGIIAALLAANELTKMFLWMPHTSLLTIFVPVFAIGAALTVLQSGLTPRLATGIGLTIGIGMLIYQVFPVAFALVVMAALWRADRKTIQNLATLTACSIGPYLVWYTFIRFKTGGFYHGEFHGYNQVGWMMEAWQAGNLLPRLAELFWSMVQGAFDQSHVALTMLVIAGIPAVVHARAIEPAKFSTLGTIGVASALVCLLGGAFFSIVGLAMHRTAYIMVPPVIVAAAALFVVSSSTMRPRTLAVAVAALFGLAICNVVEIAFYRVAWH